MSIFEAYNDERRKYHNWEHINVMTHQFTHDLTYNETVRAFDHDQKEAIALAILWHDIVYDPMLPPNESEIQSAKAMMDYYNNPDHRSFWLAESLILATCEHFMRGVTCDNSIDHQVKYYFLDLDLWTFGYDYEDFVKVNQNIYDEFLAFGLSPDNVSEGRYKFLLNARDSGDIYKSGIFNERNDKAKENIERLIIDYEHGRVL